MTASNTPLERIAAALSRLPSGCSILTARTAERRTGLLASWIQQAAFDPPMISVAVRKGRTIEGIIDASGGFVVNVLGENPVPMFKHFGKGFSAEEDAFEGVATTDVGHGVVIAEQIAWLAGEVRGKHEAGDHWLYVAEVVDAGGGEASPYVHIRKNGLSY